MVADRLAYGSNGAVWTRYSWLAELGMKWVWDWGGYRGAILAQFVMVAGFVVLMGLAARRRAQSEIGAVVATGFGVFVSLAYLSFRPATLAIVMLAGCYLLLQRAQSRWVWVVVPVTAVIVNMDLYARLVPMW